MPIPLGDGTPLTLILSWPLPTRPLREKGKGQAAGHKPGCLPAEEVVTAACADKVAGAMAAGEGAFIDFGHIKAQLSMQRLLGHLGLTQRSRGCGAQQNSYVQPLAAPSRP